MLLFIIPDVIYQFPYLILFWVLVKSNSEGRINLASDFYIPGIKQKKISNLILILSLLIFFATEAIIVTLYLCNVNSFKFESMNKYLSIYIIAITGVVFLLIFIIYWRSSGKPYKSSFH
jgi:hypothetical protein